MHGPTVHEHAITDHAARLLVMDELEQLHFERLDAFPGSVAATARREYVLIEELVPGALAPAPSAAGPASRCEVHVSQLMPVASDVPVPPYASDQPVWAQCPATGCSSVNLSARNSLDHCEWDASLFIFAI